MHFLAVKKLKKRSGFLINSYLKDSAFMQSSQLGMSKECHFSRYMKGVPFPHKMLKKGTFKFVLRFIRLKFVFWPRRHRLVRVCILYFQNPQYALWDHVLLWRKCQTTTQFI